MANQNRNRSSYAGDENWDRDQNRFSQNRGYYQGANDGEAYQNRDENYDRNLRYSNRNDYRQQYGSENERERFRRMGSGYGNQQWREGGNSSENRDDFLGGYDQTYYGSNAAGYDNQRGDWRRQNQNFGSGRYGSRQGSNYGESYDRAWHDRESRYGGDTANHGNANQGGVDRGWFDKAVDKVSSWFGGDNDSDRNRYRDEAGPHRGKGPKGYQRSDERIREDVCDRLGEHPMIDASDIDIRVEGSEVILTGTVENKEDKRRAEDIAESVYGVRNVQNQLKVEHNRNESYNEKSRGTKAW